LVDTVVFHIDAATGESAIGKIERDGVLEGIDVVQGPIVESYLVQEEGKKVAMFLDEYLQVCCSFFIDTRRTTIANDLYRSIHIQIQKKLTT
jgi:hypothetical protein